MATIEDEDGNQCRYTDTKDVVGTHCRAMVTEPYKENCLARQCDLPIFLTTPIRSHPNVPLCKAHAKDDNLQRLPLWHGPLKGLQPVTFRRSNLLTKLSALTDKYDRSEDDVRALVKSLTQILNNRREESKRQKQLSDQLERERKDVAERLRICESEKKGVGTSESQLRDEIRRLETKSQELNDELKGIRQRRDAQIQQLTRQIGELTDEKKRRDETKGDVRRLEEEAKRLRADLQVAHQQVTSLQSGRGNEAKYKADADTLSKRLQETKSELELKRRELEEAKRAGGTQRQAEEIAKLQDDIRGWERHERKTSQESKKVHSDLARVQSELAAVHDEKKRLERQIQEFRQHRSAAGEEKRIADSVRARCGAEIDQLTRQLTDLRSRQAGGAGPVRPTGPIGPIRPLEPTAPGIRLAREGKTEAQVRREAERRDTARIAELERIAAADAREAAERERLRRLDQELLPHPSLVRRIEQPKLGPPKPKRALLTTEPETEEQYNHLIQLVKAALNQSRQPKTNEDVLKIQIAPGYIQSPEFPLWQEYWLPPLWDRYTRGTGIIRLSLEQLLHELRNLEKSERERFKSVIERSPTYQQATEQYAKTHLP